MKGPGCVALQEYFGKWGNEGIIDFKDEFTKLITLTAARTLLGAYHGAMAYCVPW